jgi:ribulose-5-phosphate 4-epimerase/fuculose-1-phosphate aldolase
MQDITSKTDAFVKAAHKVGAYNLVKCSSGNMSWRLDDEHALVSATGSWLGEITPEQVSVCKLKDGTCVSGPAATIESQFHLGILRQNPEVNVVLHFQSPYATAIACGDPASYNYNVIIEIPAYIGTPAVVAYMQPGSNELAQAVIDAMKNAKMVILRNHGLVTVGKDFNEAIERATFFELACQILLSQDKPKFFNDKQIEALRKTSKV